MPGFYGTRISSNEIKGLHFEFPNTLFKRIIVKQSTHMGASDPVWPDSGTDDYLSLLPRAKG